MAVIDTDFSTPVVLIVFKRPDTTRRVLESLRDIKPKHLFVIADGPRQGMKREKELCHQSRDVLSSIDWGCDLRTNFSDVNLGLGRRVATGLDWVFSMVERAIILEDDCLMHPTFFPYCEELLDRYADDERVMHIAASNFQRGKRRTSHSYYFSRYAHCWGWATWRRAWSHFDFDMADWPELRGGSWMCEFLEYRNERRFWKRIWDRCHAGKQNTWAARWQYACWKQHGLSILPERNMVQNIGFSEDATHTSGHCWQSRLPALSVQSPLNHASSLTRAVDADHFTHKVHYQQSFSEKIINKIRETARFEYCHDTPE